MEELRQFLGHYHAFFAHFPIALIVVGAVVRLWWALRPSEPSWHGSQVMLGLGAASTFLTILSGLSRVHFKMELHGTLALHRNSAIGLGVWSVLHLMLILFRPNWAQTRVGAAVWALIGAALALTTGYFGGEVADAA